MINGARLPVSAWQSGILIEVADARLWPRSVLVMIFMIERCVLMVGCAWALMDGSGGIARPGSNY